ncbi:MAG TPA: hypothetical protein VM077_02290 [Candidatus Limnocylindrales bacterium]|nr:hypothetical protein [Candidatus Limnocylindrales bacterium]
MSIEAPRSIDTQADKEPVRIARAVLVAPIPVPEILGLLRSGIPVKNIPFTEVMLIQKSEESILSAGQVMAVGGAWDPKTEDKIKGALREVGEEVTATSMAENLTKLRWQQDIENGEDYPYQFRILGEPAIRELSLFVLPVQSRSIFPHESRESESGHKSEDKIGGVLHFSPREFEELIENGFLKKDGRPLRAAGHFAIEDMTVDIDEENNIQRKKALGKVIKDVNTFDQQLRQATLLQINLVRRMKREPDVKDLSFCTPEEVARGFVGAQMRLALGDEKRNELDTGPHQLDGLLKIPPYLATELPAEELSDLLYSIPNKEGRRAVQLLTNGFSKGAEVIISRFQDPEPEAIISRGGCREEELRSVWPQFLELPLGERVALINKANEVTIEGITSSSNGKIIIEDVESALQAVENWHDYITNETRNVEVDMFQEHRPMNEISNSLLFTKMIYALGMHPNRQIGDESQSILQRLRVEAIRDFAVFITEVEAAKLRREADISLFQGSLDSFFQFPPMTEYLDLGNGREQPVYHRKTGMLIDGRELHIIVDERPKKTVESIARKRFLDPHVRDIFSINFVLADDNFKGSRDPFNERLRIAEAFRDGLITHVREEMAESGWNVSIVEETHKRGVIDEAQRYWNGMDADTVYDVGDKGGKRAGSKGDAIIREKFILRMENAGGKSQVLEVCIYPFESSKSDPVRKLSKANYWGFAEKLNDDYDGTYKGERILSRSDKHPTQPSLYERLYPGSIYPRIARRMRGKHVLSKKARNKKSEL